MMQLPIFTRYERKYVITSDQKDILWSYLRTMMADDPYSIDGTPYTIHNIYFDTEDFSIIRHSIEKPPYKDKCRLRCYIQPRSEHDSVFMEIKKKHQGRINKRRVTMTYGQAVDYLEHGTRPDYDTYLEQQVMNEIDYFFRVHKAGPAAYLRYDRIALMSHTEPLRVTFDHNIIYRNDKVTLDETSGFPVLMDGDHWLMEIKSEANFPLWIVRKLSELGIHSQSFSKYGTAYRTHLSGATSNGYIMDQD